MLGSPSYSRSNEKDDGRAGIVENRRDDGDVRKMSPASQGMVCQKMVSWSKSLAIVLMLVSYCILH